MLDEARRWAETQFGTADLGDARRTHRLVSIMAAIARAPDESLPRQLGSLAETKAGYRLFDCGRSPARPSWTRMSRSAAPRRRGIRSSSWSTTTRSSISRRIARSRGPAASATTAAPGSWLTAVWPCCPRAQRWASPTRRSGRARPRASRPRPASRRSGPTRSRRSAALPTALSLSRSRTAAPTSSRISSACGMPAGTRSCGPLGSVAWFRAAVPSQQALRAARPMGASSIRTKPGEAVVCVAWRELELLPPRNGPRGRAPIRVRGVRVWNDRLAWLLLTTRPIESLDQALEIVSWYTRRWIVEEFHEAWTTGCRAEERRLTQADRLVPLLGALAIVAVRLLTLRDAARRDGTAPADAPVAALTVLAAKLQRPAECFGSNRAFLRGVAQLGGFLARTSDGEPGWQTLWKGWSVLMTLVEGYELAQTITSANRNVGKTQA